MTSRDQKFIDVRWNGMNRKHYEALGYTYVKKDALFTVPLEHLPRNCQNNVSVYCGDCGDNFNPAYNSYKDCLERYGHFVCRKCGVQRALRKYDFQFKWDKFTAAGLIPKFTDENIGDTSTPMPFVCPNHEYLGVQYMPLQALMYEGRDGCIFCRRERRANSIRGEGNPSWKGGTTEINNTLRKYVTWWKTATEKYHGERCIITGSEDYEIHHTHPFNMMVKEAFRLTKIQIRDQLKDYHEWEVEALGKTVSALHIKHGLGVCLHPQLHDLFHKWYGNCYTQSDYWEFLALFSHLISPDIFAKGIHHDKERHFEPDY